MAEKHNPLILAFNAARAVGASVLAGEAHKGSKATAQALLDALPESITVTITPEWVAAQTKKIDATVRAIVGAAPSARPKGPVAGVGTLERMIIEGGFLGYTGAKTPADAKKIAAQYVASMTLPKAVAPLGAKATKAEKDAFLKASEEAARVTAAAAAADREISTRNSNIRRVLVAMVPKPDVTPAAFKPVEFAQKAAQRVIDEVGLTLNASLADQVKTAFDAAIDQALIDNRVRAEAMAQMGPALI